MAESHRKEKVGAEIRKVIGNMLIKDIKDPRLDHMISISACDISPDLSYCIVYISILDDKAKYESANTRKDQDAGEKTPEKDEKDLSDKEKTEREILDGFESCSGMIRKKIGREIKLRRVPQLDFRIDRSEEYGSKMDKMLRDLGL